MRTLDDLPVVDSTGYPVDIGSELDGGNGITGEIVAFPESWSKPDGAGLWEPMERVGIGVMVEWPDADLPEFCPTQLAFAGGYVVLLCPEITSIDSEEAPDESNGRRYEFNQN